MKNAVKYGYKAKKYLVGATTNAVGTVASAVDSRIPRAWGVCQGKSNLGGKDNMIKPLGDRVVIEVAEVELKTKSGIIMPETSKEKPQKGKIVAVGNGKLLDNGTRAVPEVEVGQEVLFNKYAGSEVKVDDKEYLVIRESDILAII